MKFGLKITILFVLAMLIIGIVGIRSYVEIQQAREMNRWVIHTRQVMEGLGQILSELKDAETGQRGFVLTGEERYLEPYKAATTNMPKTIETVSSLIQDNPEQLKSLQQLSKLSGDKLAELQETIELRRVKGMGSAIRVIRTDRGKRIMDDIRAIINQMDSREGELLDKQNRSAAETAKRSMTMLGFSVVLSLVILGIAAVIVIRTIRFTDSSRVTKDSRRMWIGIAARYAFALVMAASAISVQRWLVHSYGPMPLFILMYPEVLLVATIAGGGPGVLATLLSVLAVDYWLIAPIGTFNVGTANDAIAAGIFTGTGIFLSALAERLKRARMVEAINIAQEKDLALLNMGNVMLLDVNHRILSWSEGNHRLYGYSAEEAEDQLTYELLQTHFAQPLEQIQSELLDKEHWEGEVTRRTKDGIPLSIAVLWAVRRDERGKPLDILEVSTDLTARKTAEESLRLQSEELAQQNEELSRQSEELLQQSEELSEHNEELQTQSEEIQSLNAELGQRGKTLQILLDAARLLVGEQEVLEKICQATMEMIGQPATGVIVCEVYGNELRILAHCGFEGCDVPLSWRAADSFINLVIHQDRTAALEDSSLRPDLNIFGPPGHPRFAAALSSPLHVKGKCIGAVSIYSKIPQQWTTEQFRLIEWLAAQCSHTLEAIRLRDEVLQSQKQNEFLANIVENSSQAFGVGYPDGRLGLTNKAFEQLTGYSSDELRSIDWSRTLTPPEWLEIEQKKLAELHDTGLPVRYEKEYVRKDGRRVPIELLVHLIRDADGTPLYYYSFITDITERKEVGKTLAARTSQLEESNKELESFIYSVSHDLRQPLRSVSSFAQIAQKGLPGGLHEKEKSYLSRVIANAAKMSELIESMLTLSKISRQDIKPEAIDLNEVARKIINELHQSEQARHIDSAIQKNLMVVADPVLIEIVLTNLIGNAWKFTAKTDNARLEFGATENDHQRIFYVRDNGVGFNPEYAKNIFKPFHRLHSESEFDGNGVGLSIVERIINRHGGKVWAEGDIGKGATIYFALP